MTDNETLRGQIAADPVLVQEGAGDIPAWLDPITHKLAQIDKVCRMALDETDGEIHRNYMKKALELVQAIAIQVIEERQKEKRPE